MSTSSKLSERVSAIHLLRSGRSSREVAQQLGKSVAWVYKWRKCFFENQNWDDLQDHSHAPKHCSTQISPEMRQAVREARSELEAEADQPKKLSYIGSHAVRNRLRRKGLTPLPSRASIDRILSAAQMTRPRSTQEDQVTYPQLHPCQPHQLTQIDIVPRYLPGGGCVSCFNAIDVVSRYPTGMQSLSKQATDAVQFLLQVFQDLGISEYTQIDNESCFSGGSTHPGVIGKVVRVILWVGSQAVFSPFYHPESNYAVERFHQDYVANTWDKADMLNFACVQTHSAPFYELYRQSGHHSALKGLSPAEIHGTQPVLSLPQDYCLPAGKLPITEGKVHFIRLVQPDQKVSIANLAWVVPEAKAGEGVWATLELFPSGAKLRIYDDAPDAPKRSCLVTHPFPLKEPVQPLRPEFDRPISVSMSWWNLAASLFRSAVRERLSEWFSTMS